MKISITQAKSRNVGSSTRKSSIEEKDGRVNVEICNKRHCKACDELNNAGYAKYAFSSPSVNDSKQFS
jgi:hypothetical protein